MSSATQARALIAALLNGDLTQQTRTEAHTLRFPRDTIPLRHSPATAITSVTIDDAVIDPSLYSFTPFTLDREDGSEWPAGRITIEYKTGWVEGSEATNVLEALALATAWFDTNPGAGITSFREGAEAATVTDSSTGPGVIKTLIAPWVRPRAP